MTFHLTPCSRRQFVSATVAGGVANIVCRSASSAPTAEVAHWALLADTHIAGKQEAKGLGGTVMYDNLNRVIDEILAEDPLPSGVIINGDCAHLLGFEADYKTLRRIIGRLVDGGVPIHVTMGNHDNRGPFYAALAEQIGETALVEGKHVAVLDAGPVNFFLVDSLMKVNVTIGEIGTAQLTWLDGALREHSDKPAIVMGHHNPQGEHTNINGIKDTEAFLNTLHAHPHVQSYFYGHTHDWKLTKSSEGVNLINQPPVAYVFDKSRPNGWVRMTVSSDATKLELRALDSGHPQHAESHELAHRVIATAK